MSATPISLDYPPTKRVEGVFAAESGKPAAHIPDPYQWLEDPDSPETEAWVAAQNQVTNAYLSGGKELHARARSRLEQLTDYAKYGCPFRRGDAYYFFCNQGLQNQSVLYRQRSLAPDEQPEVFLDPNLLSEDGTAALGTRRFSEDGRWFAYGVSLSGSDWQTVYVMPAQDAERSGPLATDKLEWVKFSSLAWTHDHLGFFYCRYPVPASFRDTDSAEKRGSETDANLHHKVYYHRVGTPQSEDLLFFETPDHPKWMFGVEVSDDGRYLFLTVSESTAPVNRLFYCDLVHFAPPLSSTGSGSGSGSASDSVSAASGSASASGPVIPEVVRLIDNFDAEYSYVTNEGTRCLFLTNLKAPRRKLIAIDLSSPAPDHWEEVIAHHPSDVISHVGCVAEKYLVVCVLRDVVDRISLHSMDGQEVRVLELPGLGTIEGISGRKQDHELFFCFKSFLSPSTFFRYDFASEQQTVFREVTVKDFDPTLYVAEQVFYPSKDGTKIPMFLVHAKDIVRDGSLPVLLYGYGGFSISIQPTFSTNWIAFIQHFRGMVAVPNIRGGGEYGEDWHEAGIKERKQNVFDDFCAAAQYLIDAKYTVAEKITISGGSNGGLLTAACANQRPDLFGAVIAHVGVLDMLRFHKFTIGWAWCSDYGCADEEEDFTYLIKYSPLHTVNTEKPYPALMLLTGDHDDRVVPLHSFKYIAALQHEAGTNTKNPLLIRVETKAGHGAGKPTSKRLDEAADVYTFIALALGLEWK